MIAQLAELPWIYLIVALIVIAGLFIVLKSLSMPSSFFKNQRKREELRKKLKP